MALRPKSVSTTRIVAGVSLLLAIMIGVATLMPPSNMPNQIPGSDKLHHFGAFALLTFPMIAHRPSAALWVLPMSIGYGGLIELIQPNVNRHAEWADFFADTAGALTGAMLGWGTHRLRRIRARSRLLPRETQDA